MNQTILCLKTGMVMNKTDEVVLNRNKVITDRMVRGMSVMVRGVPSH
jgi:hypothetical protein